MSSEDDSGGVEMALHGIAEGVQRRKVVILGFIPRISRRSHGAHKDSQVPFSSKPWRSGASEKTRERKIFCVNLEFCLQP